MECEYMAGLLAEAQNTGAEPPSDEFPRDDERSISEKMEPISARLVTILDAIANVLVSKKKGEVIAAAIQNNHAKDEIILTICSNGVEVPGETKDHAGKLWRQLQEIGEGYHNLRLQSDGEAYVEELERPTSESLEKDKLKIPDELEAQITELKRNIYMFSFTKLLQRIHKPYKGSTRYKVFEEFVRSLPHNRQDETVDHLKFILAPLNWASDGILKEGGVENLKGEDGIRFFRAMKTVRTRVKALLDNTQMKTKLQVLIDDFSSGFPLIPYLKKIASLPNAVEILLGLAHSPRLHRRYLAEKRIRIRGLFSKGQRIELPPSDGWEKLSTRALKFHEARLETDQENQPQPGSEMVKRFEGKAQATDAPVHCECAIVLRFLKGGLAGPPPTPYIGVSKLSCLCCWTLLNILNKHGSNFKVKGTHGKACFPWKYPEAELQACGFSVLQRNQIRDDFFFKLTESYVKRLKFTGRPRYLSDSSAEKPQSSESEEDNDDSEWEAYLI